MKFIIFIVIVFIACNSSTEQAKENIVPDTIKENKTIQKNIVKSLPVIVWAGHLAKVWADTSNGQVKFAYVSQKFQPYISFNDFKVAHLFDSKKAPIKYNSNITARRYKTVITEAYNKEGQNFAGHYCFTYWGCGSPCQESALVDLEDGKVYDGPAASLAYAFKKNSTMLIVNPPDSAGFYEDCAYCIPAIWIWNENKKLFEERLPDTDFSPAQ